MDKKEIEHAMTHNEELFKSVLKRWNDEGIIFAEDTYLSDSCFKRNVEVIKEILVEHGGNDYEECYCTGTMTENGCYYAYFSLSKWESLDAVNKEIIKYNCC